MDHQSFAQLLGNYGEFVGAIGVVVTLIYLATQIRQSNELLRSGSRQTSVANDVNSLNANLSNVDTFAKFVSGEELSSADQLRLSFIFTIDLRNREFEYFQYTNGLLDELTWLSYRKVILINHSTGLGLKWWQEVGRRVVDPEFADSVDELLINPPPDDTYERMASWAS